MQLYIVQLDCLFLCVYQTGVVYWSTMQVRLSVLFIIIYAIHNNNQQ